MCWRCLQSVVWRGGKLRRGPSANPTFAASEPRLAMNVTSQYGFLRYVAQGHLGPIDDVRTVSAFAPIATKFSDGRNVPENEHQEPRRSSPTRTVARRGPSGDGNLQVSMYGCGFR
jgi:hypothetical protein